MSDGGTPFDYTVQSFTPEQMRKLAESDPSVIVMENTHDRTYRPLASGDVAAIVARLRSITLAAESPEAARVEARADPSLDDFASKYRVLFEKMTTLAFVQDERAVKAVLALIDTRGKVERGELSARVAEETAAGVAIRKVLDDDADRVQEVAD